MKKALVLAGCILVGVGTNAVAGSKGGSTFGNLATAKVIGMGNGSFTLGAGIADATSITGMFTYGLSEYIDGRIKLGIVDQSGLDNELSIGGDFKYHLWSMDTPAKHPFELALGGLFEMIDYGPKTLWQMGGFVTGSYPTMIGQKTKVVPYGRLVINMVDNGFDSGIEFGLIGGAKFPLSATMDFFAEFQLDGNDGIFLGLEFEVL